MSPSQRGFALTEVLVALFVLGVSTVAVTGLAVLSSRTSFDSERQTVALAIANEEVEHVRSLPYDDVGYVDATGSEPDGVLDRTHDVQRNQQLYFVNTTIELVDDPINGILPAISLNEQTADYKRVTIQVGWVSNSTTSNNRNVSVTSVISQGPKTSTCTPGDPVGCPGTSSPGAGACVPNESCPDSGVCPAPAPDPVCPPGAQYCAQCYNDGDCAGGSVCNLNTRVCEPKAGACRSSSDCSNGQVCGNGQCTAACTATSCGSGEICNTETGVCTVSCVGNSCSCPTGAQCNTGTGLCGPRPSATPTPTPDPSVSPTPTPTPPPPCSSDNDCPSGVMCIEGFCGGPLPSVSPTPTPSPSPTPTPGGGGGDNPQPPGPGPGPGTPTPPPAQPGGGCDSDSQCPAGMACVNGSCQGSWCSDPRVGLVCPQVPLSDPGCGTNAACVFGGRWVIMPDSTPVYSGSFDPSCKGQALVACVPNNKWVTCPACPKPPAQCSDGKDNDGDGLIDFGGDAGCDSVDDTNEYNFMPECSDAMDNDNDGTIDWNGRKTLTGRVFSADPDCFGPDDPTERPMPKCSDGGDNDVPKDGRIDQQDPACYSGRDVTQLNTYNGQIDSEVDVACSDKINNDPAEDNLIDSADPGCHVNGDTAQPYSPADTDETNVSACTSDKGTDLLSALSNATGTYVIRGQTTFNYCDTLKEQCGANPLPDRRYLWTAPYKGQFRFVVENVGNAGPDSGQNPLKPNQSLVFYLEGTPSCRTSTNNGAGTAYTPFIQIGAGTHVLIKVNAQMPNNEFFRISIVGVPDPYCGDGVCQPEIGETFQNCAKPQLDCPTPPPPPPTQPPPPPDMCSRLYSAPVKVNCGSNGANCTQNGSIVCPPGAVCTFSGVPPGTSLKVYCGSDGAIDSYCSSFGTYFPLTFRPDGEPNDGPAKQCQQAIITKFGPYDSNTNGSNWPARSVSCSQNMASCLGKHDCTVQFSESICGGPNSSILPPQCQNMAGTFLFSCFNTRGYGVPNDGFCDAGESPGTSPECRASLNGACYYPNSNNGESASNCEFAAEGAKCKSNAGSGQGVCKLSCGWAPFWNTCPANYKCDAIPLLNGTCK